MTKPKRAVEAYKAFGPNLVCRGFQYEVGKTYKHKGAVRICESGFHACEMPFDVWNYYPLSAPLAKVSVSGSIQRHNDDSKVVGASLTVTATIDLPDFIKAAAAWVVKAAKGNSLATGNSGHAAATGNSGHAAATGVSGHAAATGNYGHAAATGFSGHAAATGYNGHAAATGNYGHAAATGDRGHAAATGVSGHAAATGYNGHAAATGYNGHAAATGDYGHAAATGDRGHAEVRGGNAIAASLGYAGTARAEEGGAIMLARYDDNRNLVAVFSSLVGENGIEAGKTYRLGKKGPEEVK